MYPTAFDNLSKPSPSTIRGVTGGISPAQTVAALIQSLELVEYHLGLFPAGVTFTADYTTSTFTSTAHGLANNDIINVNNSGGALPAGLAINVTYFVINVTTNTFQLSTTRGGSLYSITNNGTGTNTFQRVFSEGKFLIGGAGTFTDYSKAVPAGDVVGTTDTQTLTNKTLTNATITQDAVTGYTNANNGTVYGIPVTASKISGAALTNSTVGANQLNTGAATMHTDGSSTTTSGAYGNLADAVTTSVTVTIGANGLALVSFGAESYNSSTSVFNHIGFDATGTNSIPFAANAQNDLVDKISTATIDRTVYKTILLTGLTPGVTTFTLGYQTSGGTATFYLRQITVVPL